MKLTRKQVHMLRAELINTKKNWRDKRTYAFKLAKSCCKEITDDRLEWFLEQFLPSEDSRLKREFFDKCQDGRINNKFTPTDVANDKFGNNFDVVTGPKIGGVYHLSWAFKAAKFRLVGLDDDGIHGYVDNPKYKRKEPLKIKLIDLRHLKK